MSSDQLIGRFTIGDLIKLGAIRAHKDGNFGSLYPKIEDFVDDGYPLLTAKVVSDGRIDFDAAQKLSKEKAALLKYGFIQPKDVLLSHNATVGRVAIVPDFRGCALIGTSLTYFRLDESKLLPRYLAAFFEGRDFQNQLSAVMGLSTRNQVPITAQRLLEIEVPSLHEQHRISDFVSVLDDRITLLRETNATLEAIAQALFKSWFVDFDPVRAKMAGRAPEGLDEATAALFPDTLEETELGVVPRGWRYCSLKEVVEISDSKRVPLSGAERSKRRGQYPYYGAAALMDHVDDYLFDGVYLLTGEDGSVADEAGFPITQYVWGKFWVNNHAHVLQGCNGVATEHVMLSLRQTNIQPFITGAVQAKLSQSNMWRIQFLLPPPAICVAFGEILRPLFTRVRHNSDMARVLADLRDALLPRLISGQLRLPEAQAMLEEAT